MTLGLHVEPLAAAPPGVGFTNDLVRRQNLSTVLRVLHYEGPQSRTALGARVGLNRSTITGLVSDLLGLGLVREGTPGPAIGRGRPTTNIEAASAVAVISVRAEVDAITVGLVGLGGEVHSRIRHDFTTTLTQRSFVQIVSGCVEAMRADIDRHYRVIGAGVAIPGLVDDHGIVLAAPSLQWRRMPIAAPLSTTLGMPVRVGNAESLGALAESRFGVGAGVANQVYLAGSTTGIGGGVILGGELLRGTHGYAGELGHTLVQRGGRRCSCGRNGCLDAEVNLATLLPLLHHTRLDEDELDIELGLVRDASALREVARQVDLLSEALTNFVNIFSPDLVVLSGYLGALLTVSRERLAEAVRITPVGAEGRTVRIERARLRSRLMQIGPAELAFADLLANPAALAG